MCEVEGTGIDIRFEESIDTFVVVLPKERALHKEEVIRHLGSSALASRTRDRLYVSEAPSRTDHESGVVRVLLKLKGVGQELFESWIVTDIREALRALFPQMGVAAA